jgi:hypothetical protein
LLPWVVREIDAEALMDQRLECADEFFKRLGIQLVVELHAGALLALFQQQVERVALLVRLGLEAEHNVAIHLDEAAVGVEGEAGVAGAAGEALHGGVVEAEIEDGVHHARHGDARAGAHRDEQWVVCVAETHAHGVFDVSDASPNSRLEALGHPRAEGVKGVADLGGDGEAGWDRDPDATHLGEASAFAAEEVFHLTAAVGLPVAKEIHEAFAAFAYVWLLGAGGGHREPLTSGWQRGTEARLRVAPCRRGA